MFTRTLFSLFTLVATGIGADAPIRLWEGNAPGEIGPVGEEKDQSKPGQGLVAGKPVIRLGNVTDPMIEVYRAPADKNTGTAVVVCPGGGYNILAYDLEGKEVCEWLNSQGVTGILLKYRVPAKRDTPRQAAPLQDAQRAMSMVRHRAKEWGIDPVRVGILGFSAGGHLAASASNAERAYPAKDAVDEQKHRPDFTVLIYPAYLAAKDNAAVLASDLKVDGTNPPTFMAISQDDAVKVEGTFVYGLALKAAKVPWELHVYPVGGHGYGLRRTEKVVTSWPDRLADWMRASGWLNKQ
jgi:acetyl esterase/lipase